MEDITKDAIENTDTVEQEGGNEMTTGVESEANTAESSFDEQSVPNEQFEPEEQHPENEPISPLEKLMQSGLSEREAMLILNDREQRRNHQMLPSDSLPRMAHSPRLSISYGELMQMKEIFEGLSDTEINRLYNKVTK